MKKTIISLFILFQCVLFNNYLFAAGYGRNDDFFNKYTNRRERKESFLFKDGVLEKIVFLGIPSIFAIVYLIYYLRKKRIKDYCEENYFVYEDNPISLTGNSEGFDILAFGDSSYFYNGMYKQKGDIEINIVDYTTYKGLSKGGRRKHSYNYTLCQLYKPKTQFPVFFMRDENAILDSIGSMIGGQDIDFVEDKKFSDAFVLQGDSESDVRQFFNAKVRNTFIKYHKRGYHYESKGRCFLLYVKGHVGLNKKVEMLNTALRIFNDISSTGFVSSSLPEEEFRNPKYY